MSCSHPPPSHPATIVDDPYLWLEEVEGEKALTWARAQSQKTRDALTENREFKDFLNQALTLRQAEDRLPYGRIRGELVYNFWQDAEHPKGLWRRTPLKEYRNPKPKWEVLLDVDRLARDENEDWIFKGTTCFPPQYHRCLITLSRGGSDAAVIREFDLEKKAFLQDGFRLAEAKSGITWLDIDTVLVTSEVDGGSITRSGYARTIRLWRRGEPLLQAPVLLEGKFEDVWVSGDHFFSPQGDLVLLDRALDFFHKERWLLTDWRKGGAGRKVQLDLPLDTIIHDWFENFLIVSLRSEWKLESETIPQGTLVAIPRKELGSISKVYPLLTPGPRMALQQVAATSDRLVVVMMNQVQGELFTFEVKNEKGQASWKKNAWPIPASSTLSLVSANPFRPEFFLNQEGFLQPASLFALDSRKVELAKPIKVRPSKFNSDSLLVEQLEATSKDGTKIPYFVVRPRKIRSDGKNQTLLYGYGGFNLSIQPYYNSVMGRLWLENGGIYVLATIRGGGEFGPAWHKAAMQENRPRAYEDFLAVGEDLISRKITRPSHLGIYGASNGGLLVGVALTQRPDLFSAVFCKVPLLDMLRYTELLAGASWAVEYGDPKDPKMRKVLQSYSPYHQLKEGGDYPVVFFHTSTKDDRVHPGHARKMAKRMLDWGHKILYFEYATGGHPAAADLSRMAETDALMFSFFRQHLK